MIPESLSYRIQGVFQPLLITLIFWKSERPFSAPSFSSRFRNFRLFLKSSLNLTPLQTKQLLEIEALVKVLPVLISK